MLPEQTISDLKKVIDLLQTVPAARFDFNRWVGLDWLGDKGLSCGTAACIAGFAATLPEFQARGLHLERYDSKIHNSNAWLAEGSGLPVYKDKCGVDALAEFFGIPWDDAEFLFVPGVERFGRQSPDAYATLVVAIVHIEQFMRSHANNEDPEA